MGVPPVGINRAEVRQNRPGRAPSCSAFGDGVAAIIVSLQREDFHDNLIVRRKGGITCKTGRMHFAYDLSELEGGRARRLLTNSERE